MKITSTDLRTGNERTFATVESAQEWWETQLAADGCKIEFEKIDEEPDGSYALAVRRVWAIASLNQGEREQGFICVDAEG